MSTPAPTVPDQATASSWLRPGECLRTPPLSLGDAKGALMDIQFLNFGYELQARVYLEGSTDRTSWAALDDGEDPFFGFLRLPVAPEKLRPWLRARLEVSGFRGVSYAMVFLARTPRALRTSELPVLNP